MSKESKSDKSVDEPKIDKPKVDEPKVEKSHIVTFCHESASCQKIYRNPVRRLIDGIPTEIVKGLGCKFQNKLVKLDSINDAELIAKLRETAKRDGKLREVKGDTIEAGKKIGSVYSEIKALPIETLRGLFTPEEVDKYELRIADKDEMIARFLQLGKSI